MNKRAGTIATMNEIRKIFAKCWRYREIMVNVRKCNQKELLVDKVEGE